MKNFYVIFFSISLLIILYSCLCSILYFYQTNISTSNNFNTEYFFSNNEFFWPTPGFHTVTSYFGKRLSPTTGASSNHSGIDISAPEGTSIFSILSGTITYAGFYGANGHTIIIENSPYSIQYSHVSPNYLFKIGDIVSKGELIAFIGPKYINDIPNNPYKDSNGKNTNGATTGPHLHLTIKKESTPVDPLIFF